MPYSDKSLRKAAMARYEQAMHMPSNPMIAPTKDEGLSCTIDAMKDIRDSFQ